MPLRKPNPAAGNNRKSPSAGAFPNPAPSPNVRRSLTAPDAGPPATTPFRQPPGADLSVLQPPPGMRLHPNAASLNLGSGAWMPPRSPLAIFGASRTPPPPRPQPSPLLSIQIGSISGGTSVGGGLESAKAIALGVHPDTAADYKVRRRALLNATNHILEQVDALRSMGLTELQYLRGYEAKMLTFIGRRPYADAEMAQQSARVVSTLREQLGKLTDLLVAAQKEWADLWVIIEHLPGSYLNHVPEKYTEQNLRSYMQEAKDSVHGLLYGVQSLEDYLHRLFTGESFGSAPAQ
ncbi:hypothetical protein DFH27DRAFT_600269 [Peziza echinospora]|nr:hypothetical protein DFH27DRAFT_600269 [Peziza echinospora]